MNEQCEACQRELELTEHHLIPKSMHNKKWCRKMFTIKEMNGSVAMVCQDCHSAIHKFHSNKDLAKKYYSIEKLLTESEKFKNFVEWVSQSDQRKFKH